MPGAVGRLDPVAGGVVERGLEQVVVCAGHSSRAISAASATRRPLATLALPEKARSSA
jgi:hypothetical protein